jgi:hypothetical protein
MSDTNVIEYTLKQLLVVASDTRFYIYPIIDSGIGEMCCV